MIQTLHTADTSEAVFIFPENMSSAKSLNPPANKRNYLLITATTAQKPNFYYWPSYSWLNTLL